MLLYFYWYHDKNPEVKCTSFCRRYRYFLPNWTFSLLLFPLKENTSITKIIHSFNDEIKIKFSTNHRKHYLVDSYLPLIIFLHIILKHNNRTLPVILFPSQIVILFLLCIIATNFLLSINRESNGKMTPLISVQTFRRLQHWLRTQTNLSGCVCGITISLLAPLWLMTTRSY